MRARRSAVALIVVLVSAGLSSLAHSAPETVGTVRLANTVVPGLAAAERLSAVSDSQSLQVIVALDRAGQDEEESLLKAIYTPGNAAYHRFLTPGQYAARFNVDVATFERTVDWLTRSGMRVVYTSPNRSQIALGGTARQAESTFDVTLATYRLGSVEFRAHTQPALVPANVIAVQGLQTASSYRLPPSSQPAQQFCEFGPCIGENSPADLWKVYRQNGMSTGSGARAAVIGEGKTSTTITGLRHFEDAYGLRYVPTRSVFVANNKANDDGAGEWQIDSQAITGMAPDLEELSFYMAQDLPSVANAISAWVNDTRGPSIANMSIGGCETLNLALGTPLVEQPLLRQGALEGRSLFVSTGDTGGSCAVFGPVNLNGVENTGVPNAQWPSSSQYVIGVGGTVLYTNEATGERYQEYTWTHSGGGTSTFVPAPAWQRPLPLIKAPCSTDYKKQPVTGYVPCRGVPDVSAISGDILSNGYTTYKADNSTFPGGGTSLSAPLWAGMWARVQSTSAAPLGLATPVLYGLGDARVIADFDDISVGTNGQWFAQRRTAANPTGWDFTNGFGTPKLTALTQDITARLTAVRANTAPAQRDLVMDMRPDGTIGGTLSGPCVGPGRYSSPAGDTIDLGTGVAGDVDLVGASIGRTGPGGTSLSFTARLVDLGSSPAVKEFDWLFTYSGRSYELDGVDGVLGPTIRIYDKATNAFLGTPSGATATFDLTSNTVTVSFTVASFDAISGRAALTAGSTLSGVTINSRYKTGPGFAKAEPGFIIDQIVATGCADVIL